MASATSCRGTTWSTSSSCSCTEIPATWASAGGSTARRGMSTAGLFATGSFPVSTEEPSAGHSRAEAFLTQYYGCEGSQKPKYEWIHRLIWLFRLFLCYFIFYQEFFFKNLDSGLKVLQYFEGFDGRLVLWIVWRIAFLNRKVYKMDGEKNASARKVLLCIFLYIHICFYTSGITHHLHNFC